MHCFPFATKCGKHRLKVINKVVRSGKLW